MIADLASLAVVLEHNQAALRSDALSSRVRRDVCPGSGGHVQPDPRADLGILLVGEQILGQVAGGVVDVFADEVRVSGVACGLLDHVEYRPP